MNGNTDLKSSVLSCAENCLQLLYSDSQDCVEIVVLRVESLLFHLLQSPCMEIWMDNVVQLLENIVSNDYSVTSSAVRSRGRPRNPVQISTIEYLLSQRFSIPKISKMLRVSKNSIFRRLKEHGITVSQYYTDIDDESLHSKISHVLHRFPNTGYRRMKGFLLAQNIRVTEYRIREVMRATDPVGVEERRRNNRAIVRRQYFVEFFNELWHIDTNHKLIRWKMVVRGCIDGKTRLLTFLGASGDNRADSNFKAFLQAVEQYGIPSRVRSDKGGENVLIAEFMIERRGLNRASHICGRSVHNQRIERFWRDAFYGILGSYYNTFSWLENQNYLNIEDPRQLALLHMVFLPRLDENLKIFREAWNQHPLTTEHYHTPTQLMLMHLPPPHLDNSLNNFDLLDNPLYCNALADLNIFEEENLTSPVMHMDCFTETEIQQLKLLERQHELDILGYDHYFNALSFITRSYE